MSWISKLFKTALRPKHVTNLNSGKAFSEQLKDVGAFEYDEIGFTIIYEDFTKRLNWTDITQLNVFKVDLMTTDRIDMEIVYGDMYFTIGEDLPGWYQFVAKTKEIFPSIPKDWDMTVVQLPFARNYRTIYEKRNVM